jgi:hypothetical protein
LERTDTPMFVESDSCSLVLLGMRKRIVFLG